MTATALAAVGSNANENGTLLISGTAVSASGTSVDFTGIPSWAKRITVLLSGVSTNGTSNVLIQIGSGSVTTSGYASTSGAINNTATNSTAGFIQSQVMSAVLLYGGVFSINNITGNSYLGGGVFVTTSTSNNAFTNAGSVALSGALDRVRITTVNGTDQFDAGVINVFWE